MPDDLEEQTVAGRPPKSGSNRPRVLIVEDNLALGNAFAAVLAEESFEVASVVDGATALARIHEGFDAVVLDLHVPGLSGLELLRAWKERDGKTEFIVVTGNASFESAIEALRAGAHDYLLKPVGAATLSAATRSAIERGRSRSAAAVQEIAQLVHQAPDAKRVAEQLTQIITRLLSADDVSLMVPTGRGGALEILHSTRLPSKLAQEVRQELGQGLAGLVALELDPVIVNGPLQEHPRFKDLRSRSPVRASIIYPIRSPTSLLAVLNVGRTGEHARPFTADDLNQLRVIAATLRLALETELLSRQRAAVEQLATLGELVAVVAHELSTPVMCLGVNVQFLKEALAQYEGAQSPQVAAPGGESQVQTSGEQYREFSEAVKDCGEAAERIDQLLQDLKSMSRASPEAMPIVELSRPIHSALRLAGAHLKSCKVEVDVPEGVRVYGDPNRLAQVLINLLVNASQAVSGLSHERRAISIRANLEGDQVIVDVQDGGTGIPPEVRARIFDSFFTTKPPGVGTGLGLSISLGIVTRYGGRLSLADSSPNGTTFRLELRRGDNARPH